MIKALLAIICTTLIAALAMLYEQSHPHNFLVEGKIYRASVRGGYDYTTVFAQEGIKRFKLVNNKNGTWLKAETVIPNRDNQFTFWINADHIVTIHEE